MSRLILAPGEVILDTLSTERCTLQIITDPDLRFQMPTTDLETFQVFCFFSKKEKDYTHIKVIVTSSRIVISPQGDDFLMTRSFSLPLRFVECCKVENTSDCKVQFPLGKDIAELCLTCLKSGELASLISTTVVGIRVSHHLPPSNHPPTLFPNHSNRLREHCIISTGSRLFYKGKRSQNHAPLEEVLPTYEQSEWALAAFQDSLKLFKEITVEPHVEKHIVSMTLCMRRRASMKSKIGNSLYKLAYAQGASLAVRTWKEKGPEIREFWLQKKSSPIFFQNYKQFRTFTRPAL